MSDTKHTPGPWTIKCTKFDEDGKNVGYFIEELTNIKMADARLIAAAPELLEACKMMVDAMHRYEMDVEGDKTREHKKMMKQAIEAIAKAEGGK